MSMGIPKQNNNAARRGGKELAYGVGVNDAGYIVRPTIDGKQGHIGLFSTPEAAHAAWLTRKLEIANELKHLMDDIDARIFPRVIEIISRSK